MRLMHHDEVSATSPPPRALRALDKAEAIASGSMVVIVDLVTLYAIALAVSVATAFGANALPGIRAFGVPSGGALGTAGALLGLPLLAALFVEWCRVAGQPDVAWRAVAGAAGRRLAVFFVVRLGLAGRRRPVRQLVGVGVLAGLVCWGAGLVLSWIPSLASTASGPDARFEAISGAPVVSRVLFFAAYAPIGEELMYRGVLLLAVAYVTISVPAGWLRRALVGTLLVGSAALFGVGHLNWSLLNATSAGIDGLLFGAVALWGRSLWPAIIAHTFFNLLVGLSYALT
jgi:membrane protease YdiL (CAAX protease family)